MSFLGPTIPPDLAFKVCEEVSVNPITHMRFEEELERHGLSRVIARSEVAEVRGRTIEASNHDDVPVGFEGEEVVELSARATQRPAMRLTPTKRRKDFDEGEDDEIITV